MSILGRYHGLTNQFIVVILINSCVCLSQKTTKTVLITAEEEKLRDPDGYAAVVELHRQMDVDESGDIDRSESKGFIGKNEMGGGSDRAKREMAFHHGNDDKVDIDELWESWFASNERSWTTSELISWLENIVKLPQYSDAILTSRLDGRALPRMALMNSSFLTDTLGVKSLKDKKKIVIKALDLVLFGLAEDGTSRAKDIALSILAVLLITVLVIFKKQQKRSSTEMEQLATKLAQLKSMESDFAEAQKRFEEEKKKRQSASEAVAAENEQVATLRSQLIEAERLLESNNSAPLALQPLLQRTCELEMSYIAQQRLECIAEMTEAIELIEKLRKKQSSIISSIKLATGASVGTDQVDSRIFSLKARMEKISITMAECHRRWLEIESLCGFQVMQQGNGSEMNFMASAAPLVNLPHPASASQFSRSSEGSVMSADAIINTLGTEESGRVKKDFPHRSIFKLAPVAPSVCSTSSADSIPLTPSTGSLLSTDVPLRPTRFITRSVTTGNSRHHANAIGLRQVGYRAFSSSSEDLRLRSLASWQRHYKQTASTPTASSETGSLLLHASAYKPTVDAEIMENEEINSHQSNSSVYSTSSNEDEKENGTQERKNFTHTFPKKMKFRLFHRSKYST